MNQVDIYLNGKRLDLFQDENISINLTIQEVGDIGRTYNDFTQSFTIPASPANMKAVEHFHRTDVVGQLDFRKRIAAQIELNSIPFRTGVLQMESVQLKGGEPYAYTLSFYGNLTSLADLFGEEYLEDLDFSAYNHTYDFTNVLAGLTTSTIHSGNIIYPLMSPVVNWIYDSGSNHHDPNNIAYHTTNDDHGIQWYELKPALKVARILEAIEARYGVNFTGDFLTDATFQKLYLWLHKEEGYMYEGKTAAMPYEVVNFSDTQSPSPDYFNLTTDSYTPIGLNGTGKLYDVYYDIVTAYAGDYYVAVLKNGVVVAEAIHKGSAANTFTGIPVTNNVENLKLAVRPASNVSFSFAVDQLTINAQSEGLTADVYQASAQTYSLAGVDVTTQMPKIKVIDFLMGLVKMHNLTIEYLNGAFNLQTIPSWYADGTERNYTQYIDISEQVVKRVPLYRQIGYSYASTEQILGKQYNSSNITPFGSLKADFDFDGGEFKIDLPFECPMFERLYDLDNQSLTNVLVYKSFTKDVDEAGNFNPYVGAPVLFYAESGLSLGVKPIGLVDTTPEAQPVSSVWYANISSSKTIATAKTLAWGAEIDPYHLKTITKSLYNEYWDGYISPLYNPKKRLFSVKAMLPLKEVMKLRLNDTIVLGNVKYTINSVALNMTTGEAEFELLNV